jgi:hypothetical protein
VGDAPQGQVTPGSHASAAAAPMTHP